MTPLRNIFFPSLWLTGGQRICRSLAADLRNFLPAIVCLTLLVCPAGLRAQTAIGASTPDSHAMLDISSTQRGLLLPRLTAAQQATLQSTLTSAQAGMLITDAVTGKTLNWSGTAWTDLSNSSLTAASPFNVSSTNTVSINPGTASGDLITWDGTNWVNMQPAVQHFTINADNRQPLLAINYCIALIGIFPSRATSEPFLGEIDLFSFNFPPKGYAFCNGQLMAINTNTALFSLLGTFYGGDGISTFSLPNLQGRVPLGMGNGAGLSSFNVGETGGSDQNTIVR